MDLNQDYDIYKPEDYDLGWWPEIVGTVSVAAMLTFLIMLADGIM